MRKHWRRGQNTHRILTLDKCDLADVFWESPGCVRAVILNAQKHDRPCEKLFADEDNAMAWAERLVKNRIVSDMKKFSERIRFVARKSAHDISPR